MSTILMAMSVAIIYTSVQDSAAKSRSDMPRLRAYPVPGWVVVPLPGWRVRYVEYTGLPGAALLLLCSVVHQYCSLHGRAVYLSLIAGVRTLQVKLSGCGDLGYCPLTKVRTRKSACPRIAKPTQKDSSTPPMILCRALCGFPDRRRRSRFFPRRPLAVPR